MGLATMDNLDTVVGSFVEKDFGKTHEYSLIGDDMFGLMWIGEEYPTNSGLSTDSVTPES